MLAQTSIGIVVSTAYRGRAGFRDSVAQNDQTGMDNSTGTTAMNARQQYAEIGRDIAIVYSLLFCGLGTLFNGVCVGIIVRRRVHQSPTGVFLLSLAISDTITLYTAVLDAVNTEILPERLRSVWLCRASSFLQGSAQLLSSWVLVAVIVDRFIALRYPQTVQTFMTLIKARIISGCLATVSIGYNLHLWWMINENHGSCRANHIGYPAWTAISWVSVTLYSFIPSVTIIFFSCLIIHAMRQENGHSVEHDTDDEVNTRKSRRQVSMLLLVTSIGFVVCTLPSASCLAMEMSLGSDVCPASSVEDLIINEAVSYGLAYLNHSCKLIVYMCTWNYFRKELSKIACSRRRNDSKTLQTTQENTFGENTMVTSVI